jgi:hypothetical protein
VFLFRGRVFRCGRRLVRVLRGRGWLGAIGGIGFLIPLRRNGERGTRLLYNSRRLCLRLLLSWSKYQTSEIWGEGEVGGWVRIRAMLIEVSRRIDRLGCHLGKQTWGDSLVDRPFPQVLLSWYD